MNILLFIFKYTRGCLPELFNNYYIRNVDIHSHVTRQQNRVHTHKCRTSAAQKPSGVMVLFFLMYFQAKYVLMSVLHVKTFLLTKVYFCYKSYRLMYYTLFACIMHFCTSYFLQIRKCNFLREHTPVGVLSSFSLDAIYFIYYFICIILFCFHIVFIMTINTFELKLKFELKLS